MRYRNPAASGYIHGLDGLRAVAVVLVLVYHLWPGLLPGGFLGVDVFFVISGFLITTLLLREHDREGRVDLVDFWRRRARRILPAMVTVVVVSVAVARLVSADLLVDIGRQVLGAVTFSTNWVEVAAGTDYFDQTTDALLNPLWSLAVEEQFYLVWPVLFVVLAASAVRARVLSRVVRAVAVGSALLMALLYVEGEATRVYYGTDTHVFGLMIGVALAYALWDPKSRFARRSWQRLRLWIGFFGTVVLLVLSVRLDSGAAFAYRGGILAASLCAMVMIAALPGNPTAYSRLLERPTLRWLGQRSYGIYLWHWPVLLIVAELRPATAPGARLDALTAAIVVVLTGVASEVSFRYVEEPIRARGYRATLDAVRAGLIGPGGRTAQLAGVAATVVVLAGVGVVTAPDRSAAQTAVEAGQRLIDAQAVAGSETPPSADDARPSSSGGHSPAPAAAAGGGSPDVPVASPSAAAARDPGAGDQDGAAAAKGEPPEVAAAPETPTEPEPGADQPDVAVGPDAEIRAAAWPRDLAVPPGDVVVGLGDSVMSGAAPALYDRFPGIHLDAEPILHWGDAPAMVRALDAEGLLRPVVVLNFGTNWGLQHETGPPSMQEVLDLLGPERRVILVTVVGVSSWIDETNATYEQVASEHPNVAVADWHAVVAARPDLLHDDATHPNMEGISVYADLIARTAERLGPGSAPAG